MPRLSLLILVAAALLPAPRAVHAHDLEDNRATLVLRDQTHLTVSLFLNYPEALHKALQPNRDYGAFLLLYSSMKPDDWKKELLRAQAKFESTLRLVPQGATQPLTLTGWTWPDVKQVQSLLQQQVMQAMVDGHVHGPPVEVHAEAVAAKPITSLSVRLPAEFQKVLVVSYRPNQTWSQPGTATDIKF